MESDHNRRLSGVLPRAGAMRSGAISSGRSKFVVTRLQNRETGLPQPSSGRDRLLSHKTLIEEYLAGLTFSENPRLRNLVGTMRRSLLGGGDRLRSVLCMEVAATFGLDQARVLPSAAAIELVHTISLIHDELPALANGGTGWCG